MGRLMCRLGSGEAAIEACQRIYADTPFRFNWRHTYRSCCSRIRSCITFRLSRRRPPNHCYRWLPALAHPEDERRARGPGYEAMRHLINTSLPTLCDAECRAPADREWSFALSPYRVPAAGDYTRAATSFAAPRMIALRKMHFDEIGCNDTSMVALRVGRPWADFSSCTNEADSHENLHYPHGPCGADWWVRANCKRSCGLCGLTLRHALQLPPRVALKAAQAASVLRHQERAAL